MKLMSINREMDSENVVYIYIHVYSAIRKHYEIYSNVTGSGNNYTEISQTQKDKYCYVLSHMQNLHIPLRRPWGKEKSLEEEE